MNYFELANDVIIKSPLVNPHSTPKLRGIKINLSANFVSAAGDKKLLIPVLLGLLQFTGIRPCPTKASESVAAFKVRKYMEIGAEVNIRGRSLNQFINRLRISLPVLCIGAKPGTVTEKGAKLKMQKRLGVKDISAALLKGEGSTTRQKVGGAHMELEFKGEG